MGSMIMRYRTLSQYPAIFLKMTGRRLGEFDQLVADLMPPLVEGERRRRERAGRKRAIGGGRQSALDERDQLLLTVVWLRQYPTHEGLGYLLGVHPPTVGRYLERVLPLLEQAGRDPMRKPDPGRKRRRKLDALLADTPELAVVIDRFEQKIQRPKDKTKPDADYSGKKKSHTLKSQVAVDEETGAMADVSDRVPGPTADLRLLEQSRLWERLAEGVAGLGDSADQGLAKLHPLCASPRKKPCRKNKPRPPEDLRYNHAFSCRRIVVENTINRLRHYPCLTQTDRQHRQNHSRRVWAVAGLVNRQLAHRLPA